MQQHASLLYRRAPFVVRSRPCLRLPRAIARSRTQHLQPHIQQRCVSHQQSPKGLLGDLGFSHLGGLHYFRVEVPRGEQSNNIDAWLRALDTCLPTHLRKDDSAPAEDRTTADLATRRDIALLLIQARGDASISLLEHLGVVQQRWEAVSWIVQLIAQVDVRSNIWSRYASTAPLLQWTKRASSLDGFTQDAQPSSTEALPFHMPSLDQLTINEDPRNYDARLQRSAIGQIWQSLGSMIIRAIEDPEQGKSLMPQVLSLLATLHHHGIVPESVYREVHEGQLGAVQQPPLLNMLSSKILTALSDAAWTARQAALQTTEKTGRGQYSSWSFGLESPGVRYRSTSQELRPEVWLELILWSCLHGEWAQEGAAVLNQIFKSNEAGRQAWSLISWQKLIDSSSAERVYSPSFGWRDAIDLLEGARPELQPRATADDKALVVRTISSEVLAAYVDAMTYMIHVGVGQRGTPIRQVLDHIKKSKAMLSTQNLGLGFATWDLIVQRIMESGGIWLERDPAMVMDVLQLVDHFGKENEVDNGDEGFFPYFIGASALPLSLMHRVLATQARAGSLEGTMLTLKSLQDFNELNQRRSIAQFFENLKKRPQAYEEAAAGGQLFNTGLAAAEYPSFFPQVPPYALAQFLNVVKDVNDTEFSRWVFDSSSAVGPLISLDMYEDPGLAPALVRFAAATDNQAVLENVMAHHSRLNRDLNTAIPTPILTALSEALMQRHKWDAVRNVLASLTENYRRDPEGKGSRLYNVWETRLLAVMSRELLRIARDSGLHSNELLQASNLYSELVITSLKLAHQRGGVDGTDTILWHAGLLASVDQTFGKMVSSLRIFPQRSIKPYHATESFNIVLDGVLETKGVLNARYYWEQWCHTAESLKGRNRADGGVFHVPRLRTPALNPLHDLRYRVVIPRGSSHDVDIRGRVWPNLESVTLMHKAIRADMNTGQELDYDWAEMRQWLREYAVALNTSKYGAAGPLAQVDDLLTL